MSHPLDQNLSISNFIECMGSAAAALREHELEALDFERRLEERQKQKREMTIRRACVELWGGVVEDWCPNLSIEFMRRAVPLYHRIFAEHGGEEELLFFETVLTLLETPDGVASLQLEPYEFKQDLFFKTTWPKLVDPVRMAASFMVIKKGEEKPWPFVCNDSHCREQMVESFGSESDTLGIMKTFKMLNERFYCVDGNKVKDGSAFYGERCVSTLSDIPTWWSDLQCLRLPHFPFWVQHPHLLSEECWYVREESVKKSKPYYQLVEQDVWTTEMQVINFEGGEEAVQVKRTYKVPVFIAGYSILKQICSFIREKGWNHETGEFNPPEDMTQYNDPEGLTDRSWCRNWSCWYNKDWGYLGLHPIIDNEYFSVAYAKALEIQDAILVNTISFKSVYEGVCEDAMPYVYPHPEPLSMKDVEKGRLHIVGSNIVEDPLLDNFSTVNDCWGKYRKRYCGFGDSGSTFHLVPDGLEPFCDENGAIKPEMRHYAQLMVLFNMNIAGQPINVAFLHDDAKLHFKHLGHGRLRAPCVGMFLGHKCQACRKTGCLDKLMFHGRVESTHAYPLTETDGAYIILCQSCKQGKRNVPYFGVKELLKHHFLKDEISNNIARDEMCLAQKPVRELNATEMSMHPFWTKGSASGRKRKAGGEVVDMADLFKKRIKSRLGKFQKLIEQAPWEKNAKLFEELLNDSLEFKFELHPLPGTRAAGFETLEAVLDYCRTASSPKHKSEWLYRRLTNGNNGMPTERLYQRYNTKMLHKILCVRISRVDPVTKKFGLAGHYFFNGNNPAVEDTSVCFFREFVADKMEVEKGQAELAAAAGVIDQHSETDSSGAATFLYWALTSCHQFSRTLGTIEIPKWGGDCNDENGYKLKDTWTTLRKLFVRKVCGNLDDEYAKALWNSFASVSAKSAIVPWMLKQEGILDAIMFLGEVRGAVFSFALSS